MAAVPADGCWQRCRCRRKIVQPRIIPIRGRVFPRAGDPPGGCTVRRRRVSPWGWGANDFHGMLERLRLSATDLAVVPTVRVMTGSARCRPAGVMVEASPVDLQFGWEGLILRSCAVDPEMSSMRHYKRVS